MAFKAPKEKPAEKRSQEGATLFAILQNLQEAVIVVDAWGTIEIVNASAVRLLGLPTEEERGKNLTLWRAVPELAKILKVASSGSLTLSQAFTQELELHYPSLRTLRLFAAPIRDTQDRFLIVLSDTTHEREDNEREIESARLGAVTQLSAGVAHELGNPLNALQIHLQLLERNLAKEKLTKGKTIQESLKIAQGEVTRLDQIIRNFLQAIRPSTPHLQPTDLIAVLEEVLAVLQAEFRGAGIDIQVELPGIPPMVIADADQLKQVYFNVLKNAKEASVSGGTLHIRAAVDEEFFMLHFTDSGVGISEENLTHLFEPYHTTKPGGTGLGLMIAQKIMRAHHGSIRVESQSNEGTTVTLIFPLKYRRFKPLGAPAAPKRPQLPR